MRTTLLTAAITCLAIPALADARLERFEALSEEMAVLANEAMLKEFSAGGADVSGLRATMPDVTWDETFRDAGRCLLGKYDDLVGKAEVAAMLERMEGVLPDISSMTLTEFGELDVLLPKGVSLAQSGQIAQECGLVAASMQRARESGFAAEMMKVIQSQN